MITMNTTTRRSAKRYTTNRKHHQSYQSLLRIERFEERTLLSIVPVPGGTPNYYGPEPNWAYSPAPTVDPVTGIVSGGIEKFVDSLPGLYVAADTQVQRDANLAAADNNIGQYIPVALPDQTTYPGSDYYEIALVQYTEKMSSSLNPTTLRGYVQLETPVNAAYSNHYALTYPDGTPIVDANGAQVFALAAPQYLGPMIVAQKDVPVRVKFTNYLPTGEGGDLFLPVDTTLMGAGAGPNMAMPVSATRVGGVGSTVVEIATMDMGAGNNFSISAGQLVRLDGFTPDAYNGEYRVDSVIDATHFTVTLKTDPGGPATVIGAVTEAYTENRATLHLHGGVTPWISDGTPHQWTTPAGENTSYPEGVSVQNVPDMPDPGPGSETFFYSNQQSARLMFYHDHAYGITRLNVYAGEAAGYLITDSVEQELIASGILPAAEVPLIIQDKTFIDPSTVLVTDPTWPFPVDPTLSNLWAPHVYMPNQNPNSLDGTNPMGRWDYGPFFWPPWPTTNAPLTIVDTVTITNAGSGYTLPPIVTITAAPGDTTGAGAIATATIDPVTGAVTAILLHDAGSGYTLDPIVTITPASGDTTGSGATATASTMLAPNLPDLSMTMEAFQDTPVVNGTLYPYYDVLPQAYRFRVLNAADDRTWNLQLYVASTIVDKILVTNGGSGYTVPPLVTITPAAGDTTGMGATATATIDPVTGAVTAILLTTVGSEYTLPPIVTIAPPSTPGGVTATATATIYTNMTEVGMVPAVAGAANFPTAWTVQTIGQTGDILDGRTGGIPDPRTIGPSMVQIGTEGGFLPTPVVLENTPIGYERNVKNITVTNVSQHTLLLGPAERADVIIDFSQFAGKTIILYNDGPAAIPAADSRLDYYTDDVNQTSTGGTVSTLAGYGPNTRTIMEFRVSANGTPQPFDLTALMNEFTTTATHQGVFVRDQDPIIVPQAAYDSAYGTTAFPDGVTAYERIQSNSLTFNPLDLSTSAIADQVVSAVTIFNQSKAIQELFENDYGRMNATLGVELPFTNGNNQTTIPYGYIDPVTENLNNTTDPLMTPIGSLADGTQLWKITHNGVDTHYIHFHLFNVQVIDRVGWDGMVKPPDPNELGWKETVRMNPLEDVIVAMRPVAPALPFGVPESSRALDPTMPIGSTTGFFGVDPNGNPVTVTNQVYNFGWEYVWHCHILSHEEMDMMRPVQFNVATTLPGAPLLSDTVGVNMVTLNWIDPTPITDPATWGNPANEIAFRIETATIDPATGLPGVFLPIASALANATTYIDYPLAPPSDFAYRVVAYNASGETASNVVIVNGFQNVPAVTIDQATTQWDPTRTAPVHFKVHFGVPVTDFATGDVTLGGTAAGTLVGTVTGSSRDYDVAVTGMTGDGTVIATLAAGVAHDAGGNPIPASTSTDNTVTYDTTAPTVSIIQTPTTVTASNSATFAFTGSDNLTAAADLVFRVSLDGSLFVAANSPLTYTGLLAGMHTFNVKSQDQAGNASAVTAYTWTIDAAAPTASITQMPPLITNNTSATFAFTGTDNVTATANLVFLTSLDGSPFVTATSPATYTGLLAGPHTFQVETQDQVGNVSTPASYTWTIDTTPPTVSFVQTPPAITGSTSPTFAFTGTDNLTPAANLAFLVSIDGGAFAAATTPVTYTGLLGGSHTLNVESQDQAGNVSTPAAYTWTIDATPPTVSITQTPTAITRSTSATFAFTGADNMTPTANLVFLVSLDGSAFVTATSPVTYNGLLSGGHTFQVESQDQMGNISTPASYTWIVDLVPPTVTINQATTQPNPTNVGPIHFTVVFSEPVLGFTTGDVAISGTTTGTKTATVTGSGAVYDVAVTGMKASGTVIATIGAGVAQDFVGNLNTASTSTSNIVTYDVIRPTVKINKAATQADPTNTSPIHFTVVFSEPVADFTISDVTLGGTAPGTKVGVLTGSGTTYDVAVSGMTKSGTVTAKIAAGLAHDAAGNSNKASTSTDNSVQYKAPAFTLTSPTSGTFIAGQSLPIRWNASNVGVGGTVSLCYDTDTIFNGNETWIEVGQVPATNGTGRTYTWNTTGMASGTYYVGGYLNAGGKLTYSHLTRSITVAAALNLATPNEKPQPGGSALLSPQQLAPIIDEAIARMTRVGGSPALSGISIRIADLPGTLLSESIGKTILIDRNAARYGWFIDTTPADDLEFANGLAPYSLKAADASPAAHRVDLLSAVMHEMGHILGYQHSSSLDLMNPTLSLGMRWSQLGQFLLSAGQPAPSMANGLFNASAVDRLFALS